MSLLRRWLALCLLAFLPVWPVGVAQAASVLFIATSNVPPGKFRQLADIARPLGIQVQVRYLNKIPADADAGLFQGQDMVFFDSYQQDEVRQHLARALPGLRAPHAWLYDARPAWGGGVDEALGRRLAAYYSNGGRQNFEGFFTTRARPAWCSRTRWPTCAGRGWTLPTLSAAPWSRWPCTSSTSPPCRPTTSTT